MTPRLLASLIAGIARTVSGVQVTWRDGMPSAKQSIFFANHTSHLDFVVLWSSLPREFRTVTRPVAAQDYWNHGLRRTVAVGVFNALLIPRRHGNGSVEAQARETIAQIAAGMEDRYSLIIFPEGTRGTGEEVAPFKSGLYYLCRQKPSVQLIPAYQENLSRILPKGEFLPVPFISRLTFGSPLAFDADEPKNEFLARARDAVCALKTR